MKLNFRMKKILPIVTTHEGGRAANINPELQLRRSVMSCLLWEDEFYEDGVSISQRIVETIPLVGPEKVAAMAIEARNKMKLRHVPLLMVREMARLNGYRRLVGSTLCEVIQRADELTEFVALYWKDGKQPLSAQVKTGLAKAFTKFDAYQLAKYNRDEIIKLRDVLFLCHPKPLDRTQEEMWKKLVDGKLESPDTWEVNLSGGKDKKETFERLLQENKLGSLALLRNLRNMAEARVDEDLIFLALERMKVERVLPYRFITAARYAPQWEDKIETAMMKCLEGMDKLSGRTVILADVSGSMNSPVTNSEINRIDVASGLAILARELSDSQVYTFSDDIKKVPARHGFALRDAIVNSQDHNGTLLGRAVDYVNKNEPYDRLIVITDEQSADAVPFPVNKGYMINVASDKNGVGYKVWTHIDGFSESVLNYIQQKENMEAEGNQNPDKR
jgi:60 kDa SS-A/Ro ribonucleoprotein